MSRFQVTVLPGAKQAVVRTLQAHGSRTVNQSLFQGAERTVINLA
jgi:hypothetical protein